MSPAEINYDIREKELLADLFGMRKWRIYLLDKEFIVHTDHRTLETLLTQRTCSRRLARWLDEIAEFRPVFKWIPGETNIVADAISRRSDFTQASTMSFKDVIQGVLKKL